MTPERLEEIERICTGTRMVSLAIVRELIAAFREADRAALDHFGANGIAYALGLAKGAEELAELRARATEAEANSARTVLSVDELYRERGMLADVALQADRLVKKDLDPIQSFEPKDFWRWYRECLQPALRALASPPLGRPIEPEEPTDRAPVVVEPDWSGLRGTGAELVRLRAETECLRDELAALREANLSLASAGSQLLGAIEERDGILREYQIEGDTSVRDIVTRTTAAAVGLRDELEGARFSIAKLCSSLPRCQSCPNPATYAWHGGDDLACDQHVPTLRRVSTGFELPYAAILRALAGLTRAEVEALIDADKAAEREYVAAGGKE